MSFKLLRHSLLNLKRIQGSLGDEENRNNSQNHQRGGNQYFVKSSKGFFFSFPLSQYINDDAGSIEAVSYTHLLGHTNPLFMGFLGYQNVNKEIIQPHIEKEQQTPKILYFRGFLYILKIYQTPSKHTKMFR